MCVCVLATFSPGFSRRRRFITYVANRKQNSQMVGDKIQILAEMFVSLSLRFSAEPLRAALLINCSSDSVALPSDPLTPGCVRVCVFVCTRMWAVTKPGFWVVELV